MVPKLSLRSDSGCVTGLIGRETLSLIAGIELLFGGYGLSHKGPASPWMPGPMTTLGTGTFPRSTVYNAEKGAIARLALPGAPRRLGSPFHPTEPPRARPTTSVQWLARGAACKSNCAPKSPAQLSWPGAGSPRFATPRRSSLDPFAGGWVRRWNELNRPPRPAGPSRSP